MAERSSGPLVETIPGPVSLRGCVTTPTGPVTAHILVLQGRTEFIEKYSEVIERLRASGCAVATFDWRGQGLSGPKDDPAFVGEDGAKRGHIDDFAAYDQDLEAALAWFDTTFPPDPAVPRILIAHSMGGMIGLRGLLRHQSRFSGAVFSAPMWGLPGGVLMKALVFLVGGWKRLTGALQDFVPGRGFYVRADEPFEGNKLTSDPLRFERYHESIADNPKLGCGGPTVAWVLAALSAIRHLPDDVRGASLKMPILIFTSTEDQIVDPASHSRIAELLPNADLVRVPKSGHEPLMERDEIFGAVMGRIDQFITGLKQR